MLDTGVEYVLAEIKDMLFFGLQMSIPQQFFFVEFATFTDTSRQYLFSAFLISAFS